MTRLALAAVVLLTGLSAIAPASDPARVVDLPDQLSDQAFWKLSAEASEPGGYFRSQDITNLTSNEIGFQQVVPDLIQRTRPGGVYLGVGPEQNFTYIAAVRPKMAIVFDIRRGNLDLQLMYKAIFELSRDRADFVAMLFGTTRPARVAPGAPVTELFRRLAAAAPSATIHQQDLAAIEDRLRRVHGFPLSSSDMAGIRTIYETFYYSGVAVRPSPTFADLMTATDPSGANRSFLASEAAFTFVKDLESRNMVVPVVGDFAGPRAIRTIGAYLKTQSTTVAAFYLSNVEDYLTQAGELSFNDRRNDILQVGFPRLAASQTRRLARHLLDPTAHTVITLQGCIRA
jgi:hypothetical protein